MGAHDAAYLAGLLDGEGCFSLTLRDKPTRGHHYRRWEIAVTLVMTTREFMEEIALLVPWGGGTVGRNARTLVGRARPAWRMKWSGTAAVELCRAIQPYVRLKKKHVALILAIDVAKDLAQSERSGQRSRLPTVDQADA